MTLGRWLPHRRHEAKATVALLRPGKAARVGRRSQARFVPRSAAPQSAVSPAAPAFVCGSVQDWLQQQCDNYRCLHIPRPQPWGEEEEEWVQRQVDLMASAGGFGRDESLQEEVEVAKACDISDGRLPAELSEAARRLVSRATGAGLPRSLGEQIQLDVEEVGAVLAKMLPTMEKLILKLELMGDNVCSRWHQDHYVGRAIISYNGCGTVYVRHDNVNFWELKNCGNNDHIIRDSSQVFSAEPADILFIKGQLFPGAVNGLVHKAPEKRYRPDGSIMTRLCLKLDAP